MTVLACHVSDMTEADVCDVCVMSVSGLSSIGLLTCSIEAGVGVSAAWS